MNLENGPYFSPDGGSFWAKDGKIYWHDGEIWDANNMAIRLMRSPFGGEDYSAWTHEKREQVKGEWKAIRAAHKAQKEAWQKEQDALVASAKSKLTEDEFNAVLLEGRDS